MLRLGTILHPTDFSESAAYAFWLACSLARDYGARLIVLHVAPPPVLHYGEGVPIHDQIHDYRDPIEQKLRSLQPPDNDIEITHELAKGDPVEEIVRVANEKHCDLIVMGTHGRTGLSRLILGRVAEQVLRKASCPVLSVKATGESLRLALELQGEEAATGDKAQEQTAPEPAPAEKPVP